MKIEAVGMGATIDEAREAARKALNAPEKADVTFEIISMPKSKILGLFGGSDAEVKASYEAKDKPKPKKKAPKKPEPKPEQKPAQKQAQKPAAKKQQPEKPRKEKAEKPAPKKESKAPKAEKPISEARLEEAKETAFSYAKNMMEQMSGQRVNVEAEIADNSVLLQVECEDHGILIGRRGETLDSIQYLVSLAVNKGKEEYCRITINVGNYRQKREKTLIALAQKTAKQVLRSGRKVTLEPMNPYERHIIHTAVQDIKGARSMSIGSNVDRRVVISLEDGYVRENRDNRDNRDNRGNRGGQNRRNQGGSRDNRSSNQNQSAAQREVRKDKEDLPLYGVVKKQDTES